MKFTLLVLTFFASTHAYAGGSSFDCVSQDGKVLFSGNSSEMANVTTIAKHAIQNKAGQDIGINMAKVFNREIEGKDLPDFATPVENKNTMKAVAEELKKSFDLKSQDATSKIVLAAIGNAKMLLSETEDVGRELGHMVFNQKFALVEVTHTPKFTQPDGGHFRIEGQAQMFQCESSYATTCGGRCNAGDEE